MKNKYKIFLIIILTLVLTGCTKNVSVENRDFADTIGIDVVREDEKKLVKTTLVIPDPSKIASGESKEVSQIIETQGENFTEALKNAEYESSNVLSLENVRVILIGEELARDKESLSVIFDAVKRNSSISKRVVVSVARGSASDVLNQEIDGVAMVGEYLTDYYNQSPNEIFTAYDKKLSKLISKLNVIHTAILPQLYVEEKTLKLDKGVLFKNGEYIDTFGNDILRGYALASSDINNIIVNVDFDGAVTPVTIKDKKQKDSFEEKNGRLVYHIVQDYDCSLTEFDGQVDKNDVDKLSRLFNDAVEESINTTFRYFVEDNNSDIYGLQDKLKKEDYDLYLKYANDVTNTEFIRGLDFEVEVTSRIINTGSTK